MHSALIRTQLETQLPGYVSPFGPLRKHRPKTIPTGIREIDNLTGGLARGSITEILGPISSGKTSLLLSTLSQATDKEEVCAFVDPADTLDPTSAAAIGVDFHRLLWIRTGPHIDLTLKVTDLLIQGGGFGLIGVDFSALPSSDVRRVPFSTWFRLQRATEGTPTVLVFLSREPSFKICASLVLNLKFIQADWASGVLHGISREAQIVKSRIDPSLSQNSCRFRLESLDCQRAVGSPSPAVSPLEQENHSHQGIDCHEF